MKNRLLIITCFIIGILGCRSSNENGSKNKMGSDTTKATVHGNLTDTNNLTIAALFLKLPIDKVYYTLGTVARDSLLKFHVYNIPPVKSEGFQKWTYKIDSLSTDYIRYEGGFEHDRTKHFYELKRFRKTGGGFILVFSCYGTFLSESSQDELKIYTVSGNTITENKDGLLPSTIDPMAFAGENIPDSVLYQWQSDLINLRYDLGGSELDDTVLPQEVKFVVDNIDEPDPHVSKKWLKYSEMVFTWNGNTFSKKPMPVHKQ